MKSLSELECEIIQCNRCKRLTNWRTTIAKKKVKRYSQWNYWGKPVPGFGDPEAEVLIVGLAPGAHGANRTGRMFTGDRSGDWLYRALYKAGFANQPTSISVDDGLKLTNCYITAACRCVPPQNKPTAKELENCRQFIIKELQLLKNIRVIIGLGKIGFDAAITAFRSAGLVSSTFNARFFHGVVASVGQYTFIGSFHPSQQNTFTKRLTESMFDNIFTIANQLRR